MKITNILRKIATPVLALVAGCMPVTTTGYCDIGAGALKPESRKTTAQVTAELGADTLFDNDRRIRTGLKYRFLPHPTEKQDGVDVDVDSHLYGATLSTPLVNKPRFSVHAGLEAGVVDTRGELKGEVEVIPGVTVPFEEDYSETSAYVGGNLKFRYRVDKDIFIFLEPQALHAFGDGNGFSYGGQFGLGLQW
jgi:hypothetical protein